MEISVFISSPSDLELERGTCGRVVRDLNLEYSGKAEIRACSFEKLALGAEADFQSQIESPARCDIVVVMLWSRLGSKLAKIPAYAQHLERSEMTGTECEFHCAVDAAEKTGKPKVLKSPAVYSVSAWWWWWCAFICLTRFTSFCAVSDWNISRVSISSSSTGSSAISMYSKRFGSFLTLR